MEPMAVRKLLFLCGPAWGEFKRSAFARIQRHYGAVAKGHQFRLMAQVRYDFLILK
jgi:hypothetical protein